MNNFFVAVNAVIVPRGTVSIVVQKRVEEAVGIHPLLHDETRGIQDMPNHFISACEFHYDRPCVDSVVVNGQVVYIHEVPQAGASCGPVWLPRQPENIETTQV